MAISTEFFNSLGQYLTFQLTVPGIKKPVIRCYSLSDSPNHPDYYRVSSSFFHDNIKEGDILDVKAPNGHFFMDTARRTPVVLIGGGIGITPVLSMLNTISESDTQREAWFFLGVNSGKDHMMKNHLKRLAKESDNVNLHICYSKPDPTDRLGEDFDERGRLSIDVMKRVLPPNNYDFYICGPAPLMQSVVPALEEWGVPKDHVHFEAFGAATVKSTAAKEEAKGKAEAGPALSVVFARSGESHKWDPSAGSLLEFAEDMGVNMDFGCRAGNCGTCLVAIKEGDVKYVGEPGTPPEAGSCLTCISQPAGDLTLDA